MKKTILFSFLLTAVSFSDVQKNKIVQDAIVQKGEKGIVFTPQNLLKNTKAFKTAVDIFFDRYKKEALTGIIARTETAFAVGSCLSYLLNIPLYKASLKKPYIDWPIDEKSRFIIIDDLLDHPDEIESMIHFVTEKKAYIMEIATFTEDLSINAREKISAQVMSIFVLRPSPPRP
ncbi:MAG: Adenine phosphoribosyltransferase [Holosporales bacterium]